MEGLRIACTASQLESRCLFQFLDQHFFSGQLSHTLCRTCVMLMGANSHAGYTHVQHAAFPPQW